MNNMKKNHKKLGIYPTNSDHFQFTHGHDIHVLPNLFSAATAKTKLEQFDVLKKIREKKAKINKK